MFRRCRFPECLNQPASQLICVWPTWWLLRGGCTRSHSEPGRETPQRRWYFVSRRGRVGRCQVRRAHVGFSMTFCLAFLLFFARRRLPSLCCGRFLMFFAGFRGWYPSDDAGWSSPVARQAHNLKVAGSNPAPATTEYHTPSSGVWFLRFGPDAAPDWPDFAPIFLFFCAAKARSVPSSP